MGLVLQVEHASTSGWGTSERRCAWVAMFVLRL
jgi:hypothetical protein